MSDSKYRVAVAQVGTPKFDLEATLAKLENYVDQAHKQQARLILFPEAFIGGYPRKSTFGSVMGMRSPEGRVEFTNYHKGAILVPGPVTDRLAKIAKEKDIFLVVGVIEREELTGTLYCSAIHVDPDHGYIGKHRKVMPTAMERMCWGFGDGSTLPVVQNRNGHRIAATICWENYMPLLRSYLYSKGVQIYCAPTVDHRPVWQSTMQHIALEGRCFVLSACQFTRQKDYPDGHAAHQADSDALESEGGSVIIDPLGNVLAGPLRDEEGLLVADLDMDSIIGAKLDLDPVGHYSRSDIFQLLVNEKPNTFLHEQQ
ncbi:nitrilase [Hesseltinella vesiculosa]|uniref:Nitrilase n=1 Tax=Hesseltinella vesiculosa TaxID=101127 RepID=A0A1X2GN82_9FUNG|nr:nitrilase [Hesseltinella vesiculosa]